MIALGAIGADKLSRVDLLKNHPMMKEGFDVNVTNAENELEPVNNFMRKKLIERDYIQADETTLKVIDDNGKDSKSKKYMWMYRSGGCKAPIMLYDYQRTRSSSCPREFLKGFSRYLQTMDIMATIKLRI